MSCYNFMNKLCLFTWLWMSHQLMSVCETGVLLEKKERERSAVSVDSFNCDIYGDFFWLFSRSRKCCLYKGNSLPQISRIFTFDNMRHTSCHLTEFADSLQSNNFQMWLYHPVDKQLEHETFLFFYNDNWPGHCTLQWPSLPTERSERSPSAVASSQSSVKVLLQKGSSLKDTI